MPDQDRGDDIPDWLREADREIPDWLVEDIADADIADEETPAAASPDRSFFVGEPPFELEADEEGAPAPAGGCRRARGCRIVLVALGAARFALGDEAAGLARYRQALAVEPGYTDLGWIKANAIWGPAPLDALNAPPWP